MNRKFYILFAVMLTLLAACSSKDEPSREATDLPVTEVRVRKAQLTTVAQTEEVVGTVRSKLRATLEAKQSGRIESMSVNLGDRVAAGAVLAKLNLPETAARLAGATAARDQAQREWQRVSTLFDQQSATRAERDAADSRLRTAEAAVEEANALLAYGQIVAPFNGVVTRKWADQGDLAVPGKPLIELEDTAVLQIEIDIPESLAQSVALDGEFAVATTRVPHAKAVIQEIAPAVDPTTRTRKVKLQLKDASLFFPGEFVRVAVPTAQREVLVVPVTALVERGQLEIIFTVENQRARMRIVKSAKCCGDTVEILSGLKPGDLVVIENADQLKDGQPVQAKE
jgi:RND family efflux transporter MFP subunit